MPSRNAALPCCLQQPTPPVHLLFCPTAHWADKEAAYRRELAAKDAQVAARDAEVAQLRETLRVRSHGVASTMLVGASPALAGQQPC